MLKQYPTEVKLVYKSFPLPNHEFAKQAAQAAFAAEKQGKFWQMHDALLENYETLDEEKLDLLVEQVGLDVTAFEKDRKDSEITRRILTDIKNGKDAGVNGTPTIFVNGKQLKDFSPKGLIRAINRAIETNKKS